MRRRWLITASLAISACTAFTSSDPPAGTNPPSNPPNDAGGSDARDPRLDGIIPLPDAAPFEAGVDYGCKATEMFETGAASWRLFEVGKGTVEIRQPNPVSPTGGNAIVARFDAPGDGKGYAAASSTLATLPKSLSLKFDVQTTRPAFEADVGCTLVLQASKRASYTATRFRWLMTATDLYFETDNYIDGARRDPKSSGPLGTLDTWTTLSVTINTSNGATALAAVDVREGDNGANRGLTAENPLVTEIDRLVLECGIPYAHGGNGTIVTNVDNITLDACSSE